MPSHSQKPPEQPGAPRGLLARLAELADFKPPPVGYGRFTITSSVGRGAMSHVFGAVDRETGERTALKVANDEKPARIAMRREIRHLSCLDHPAIVSMSIGGTFRGGSMDGREFLAMEYLEGQSLSDRLAVSGKLDYTAARGIASEICGALSHVHAAGLVHRDIKPDNVILSPAGTKIIDFGVSERIRRTEGLLAMMRLSFDPGDLGYSAPELFGGVADQRTDVFAVGSLIYRMVGGSTLDTVSYSLSGVLDTGPLDRAGASPALRYTVSRALSLKKEERFSSAAELQDSLGAW